MTLQERLDEAPIEHVAIARVGRQQQVADVGAQVAAEPGADRHAEPHLAARRDLRRNQIGERAPEHDLRVAAVELQRVGSVATYSTSAVSSSGDRASIELAIVQR